VVVGEESMSRTWKLSVPIRMAIAPPAKARQAITTVLSAGRAH
jgi:hypothetical protein